MSIEFFLTSMVVIIMPGTGAIYTMAIGLGRGFRTSIVAAFGCTLAIVPHITASIVGLAALLHASALAFQVVKYLGVAYLFYMAWRILRDKGVLQVAENRSSGSNGKIILDGILINFLNPKLSLFFLAFLPQFVPGTAINPSAMMAGLGASFMGMTFVVFVIYGAFAAAARQHILSRPQVMVWLKRSFAGAFGLLGLKLALTER